MRMTLHYRISVCESYRQHALPHSRQQRPSQLRKLHTADTRQRIQTKIVDIVRDPSDVPPSVGNRQPGVVHITLTAEEVVGTLDRQPERPTAIGRSTEKCLAQWFACVRETRWKSPCATLPIATWPTRSTFTRHSALVEELRLPKRSRAKENVHISRRLTPGLFVYHCGTPMIAEHIANGMYGLILVEPEGGLAKVDHEYYVVQGEIYTSAPKGKAGMQQFSDAKLMDESPEYFVFNGAVDALTKTHPMQAKVGETVRVFFGDAGPNDTSSLHIVGEIFTRDYLLGSLTSPALTSVQTASVPPGAAADTRIQSQCSGAVRHDGPCHGAYGERADGNF